MWECVVDYQNHRCLQQMLKPYKEAGEINSKATSPHHGSGKIASLLASTFSRNSKEDYQRVSLLSR